MSTYPELDYESDLESDFEDYPEDYGEDYPEARGGRRGRYGTSQLPQRGTGGGYTRQPTMPAPVTQEQLRQALVRVKQDIDRVANGVRSSNVNLNDLSARTSRNLNRLRDLHRRDIGRVDRSVEQTRELAILGAVLGGGDGANTLPLLLILGLDQPQPMAGGPAGTQMEGPLGTSNTTLLLALAVSGALK
jgi:hypothetical protein